jgi:hypothetical protein
MNNNIQEVYSVTPELINPDSVKQSELINPDSVNPDSVNTETVNPDKYSQIEASFLFNHTWMFFTVFFTLVISFILKISIQRYIILMETFISSVSTTIYYLLLNRVRNNRREKQEIDWKGITILRYNGWMFTTPVMLIAFLLFLSNTTGIKLSMKVIISIVLLDWLMLIFGYLGENNTISRNTAFFAGFLPFFIIFGIIYNIFLRPKYNFLNFVIYILFFIFWGTYGISYLLDLEPRNYIMNILDLLSKSGIGIIFAVFYLYFNK